MRGPEGKENRRRLKPIDRKQLVLRPVDVERLIEEDHPARAMWELVGQLDLSQYYAPIKVVEGEAGRSATDPRLLISLWLYAYSRGVSSARELSRLCQYVAHKEALDDLFTQLLGVLSAEGLVTLEQVMHDGTKVRANAGTDTFRREERLRAHLDLARQQVEAMGDPRAEDVSKRVAAARQRALREREQRLEQALAELEAIQATKADDEAKQQARASMTDPHARVMKQPDGGYAPSYNVQVSTDGAAGAIVGVGVTQSGSDYRELAAGVERVEEHLDTPQQMVVDGGFVSRENILALHAKQVELIGPWEEGRAQSAGQMQRRGVAPDFYPEAFTYEAATDTYTCPAGKTLGHAGKEKRIGQTVHHYRAPDAVCQACAFIRHAHTASIPALTRPRSRNCRSPSLALIQRLENSATEARRR
jgi:transposase